MPLNQSQIDTINASIDHMLDFPLEAPAFYEQEKGLMTALTGSVDKDNDFYWLNKCLKKPTEHFQKLETQSDKNSPAITVGEVQDAIIARIFTSLSLPKHPLFAWDENKIRALFSPAENRAAEFKSQKAPVDGGENLGEWEMPKTLGKIYSQELRIIEEKRNISFSRRNPVYVNQKVLCVEVSVEGINTTPVKETVHVKYIPSHLRSDAEDDRFIRNSMPQIESCAKNCATQIALDHLKKKYNLPDRYTNSSVFPEAIKDIVTHKYWFDLLNHGFIQLAQIYNLDLDATKNLSHSVCLALLENNILDFHETKRLTPAELRVMSHYTYLPLIKDGSIPIKDIKYVSAERALFLVSPPLTNLIQRHKITFNQAKNIPRYLQPIILNNAYMTFFLTHTISWDKFGKISEDQCDIMLNKHIIRLLSNDIIKLDDVLSTMDKNSAAQDTLFDLVASAFTRRLYMFCHHKPLSINSVTDTIDILKSEMLSAAEDFRIPIDSFKEWLWYKLSSYLKNDIQKIKCRLARGDDEINIFNKMIIILNKYDARSENPWAAVFTNLIAFANETRDAILQDERVKSFAQPDASSLSSPGFTVFPPPKSNKRKESPRDDDIKKVCESIIALDGICNEMQGMRNSFYF